jgi:quinol monooxygenase YgiN
MPPLLHLSLAVFLTASSFSPQATAPASSDTRAYAVLYIEVMSASRAMAVAALKQYRDATRKEDGYVRLDVFEQAGRPGHFAIVETWRDQKAIDAHVAASQKQLFDMLRPIRLSEYDVRPYKTLNVGSTPAAVNGQAVSVVTHVDLAPPSPQAAALLQRLAEQSRQDPGNVRFDVIQHTMRANHFTVIETWRDQKALDGHISADHTKQYRDELQPMTGSPLDERIYRAVE